MDERPKKRRGLIGWPRHKWGNPAFRVGMVMAVGFWSLIVGFTIGRSVGAVRTILGNWANHLGW